MTTSNMRSPKYWTRNLTNEGSVTPYTWSDGQVTKGQTRKPTGYLPQSYNTPQNWFKISTSPIQRNPDLLIHSDYDNDNEFFMKLFYIQFILRLYCRVSSSISTSFSISDPCSFSASPSAS